MEIARYEIYNGISANATVTEVIVVLRFACVVHTRQRWFLSSSPFNSVVRITSVLRISEQAKCEHGGKRYKTSRLLCRYVEQLSSRRVLFTRPSYSPF